MRVKSAFLNISAVWLMLCLCAVAVADPPTWTISGVVATADGTGVEGVNIVPDGGISPTITAADGTYSIVVPNHWDGTVTVNKTGWLITSPSRSYTNVIENLTGQNYTTYQPKISGYVTKSDSTPLAGATVTANNSGGSAITDASGHYELYVPYNWSGTVSATLTGYYFTDKSYTNITTDQTTQDFSGYQPTISGSTSVAGATVTISGVGVTTSTPNYSVIVPYGWSGTITVELAGYGFTNSPLSYTNVTSDLTNQNFTPFQPTISGSTGVSGATVTVSGVGSIVSSPEYSVTVPYGWSGTVTVDRLGWSISPSSRDYLNVVGNLVNQDYAAERVGITVKEDGSGDCPTIQVAIESAMTGDIILVEDGTYTGDGNRDIDFLGKAVTVRGNIDDPNLVVIDCQGTEAEPHRGFKFVSGEGANSILEGLTITNGYGLQEDPDGDNSSRSLGGGIYCNDCNPTISNCIISGNTAYYYGGGLFGCNGIIENCIINDNTSTYFGGGFYGCDGTISNCTVTGNLASYGGGFSYCDGTILNCTVTDNSASPGGGFYGCDGTISNCTVTDNSASPGGGFSYCDGTISNCVVSGNSSNDYGGGFYDCDGTISNCVVFGNSASYGGGFCSCDEMILNCTVTDNSSNDSGGGFYGCDGTISNCTVTDNSASPGGGFSYCDGTISNCVVSGNSSNDYGGGFYDCDGTISNCVVFGNSASYGGGFCSCDEMILNCTVTDNSSNDSGGGFYGCSNGITNDIIWGNNSPSGQQLYNCSVPSYSCVEGWNGGGEGNISSEPLFVDSTGGDYHLLFSSPCINAGDPSYVYDPNETDIDGQARVIGPIDMGVDEFYAVDSAAIYVSQKSLDFISEGKNGAISTQIVNIFNCGAYNSNWSVIEDCDWLYVLPECGQTGSLQRSEFAVSIAPTYAEYGLNTCQFTVSDPNASNSPQVVTVTLDVLQPEIELNQSAFSFIAGGIGGSPVPQVLAITNSGYDTLNWVITDADTCEWLLVSQESGQTGSGMSTDVSLSVDPTYAEYGLNTCQFTVSDPDASNSPQVVTVILDVLRPEIGVSPESISFECEIDDPNVAIQTFSISNSGYDTLNWQIVEDCNWLSVSPASGQCSADPNVFNEMTLTVDTAGLEIGYYNCELTITDENASNSPVTVPVSLHVYRDGERHVPTEYSTIWEAIYVAVDGDHIIVHPGLHTSMSIYNQEKALTIRSLDPTDPEIVSSTILRGPFRFDDNEDRNTVLEGFTLNGAVECLGGASPIIRNCVINAVDRRLGCAIAVAGNRDKEEGVLIQNCVINFRGSPDDNSPIAMTIYTGKAEIVNSTIAYAYADSYGSYFDPTVGVIIDYSDVSFANTIIWGNRATNDVQIAIRDNSSRVYVAHSDVEGGQENILIFPDDQAYYDYRDTGKLPDPNLIDPNILTWGPGNIDADPLFVREPNDGGDGWVDDFFTSGVDESANNDYGDLHLKSRTKRFVWDGFARADFNFDKQVDLVDFAEFAQWWRYVGTAYNYALYDLYGDYRVDLKDFVLFFDDYLQPRVFGEWVVDDVTSPCIDAGDPNDAGWQNELWPHGGRINMGAYGGTPQASMSPNDIGNIADLNHDNAVDLADWSLWADDWLAERTLLDSDFDRDNDVDPNDLDIFMDNWLWEQ